MIGLGRGLSWCLPTSMQPCFRRCSYISATGTGGEYPFHPCHNLSRHDSLKETILRLLNPIPFPGSIALHYQAFTDFRAYNMIERTLYGSENWVSFLRAKVKEPALHLQRLMLI